MTRPAAEARELTAEILQAIRQPDGELASTLTLSAGLARWVPSESSVDVAAAQALEAVDLAKRLGRDRCVVHGERATSGAGQRGVVARMLKQALDDDALEADEFRGRDAGVFDFEAKPDGFLDPVEKLVE